MKSVSRGRCAGSPVASKLWKAKDTQSQEGLGENEAGEGAV